MADDSILDSRYFVDRHKYNCPFCNRRHVSYHVSDYSTFDWTDTKKCKTYYVTCDSCGKISMHLSFSMPHLNYFMTHGAERWHRFDEGIEEEGIDENFFYSIPTSFFSLDQRIPKLLRDVLIEAEGCLKGNFLTGASACARKMIYELAILHGADGTNYDEKIRSLKEKLPDIESSFFDSLLTIQQMTSAKVHENSYDGWDAKHLRIILAAVSEVLHEIYVLPALKKDRRNKILDLKEQLTGNVAVAQVDSGGGAS